MGRGNCLPSTEVQNPAALPRVIPSSFRGLWRILWLGQKENEIGSPEIGSREKGVTVQYADTPVSVIKGAIDTVIFTAFVADAIVQGRVTPNTLQEEIKIDVEGHGLAFKKTFTASELKAGARNILSMAFGTAAIATDRAMDAVFGDKDPDDTSDLGSARTIIYQIRCAFAHDPLNPVWNPKDKYNKRYRVTVNVPKESGETTSRMIEFYGPTLKGRHLGAEDFGGLGGYCSLLQYCLNQVKAHPRGMINYVPPVEPQS